MRPFILTALCAVFLFSCGGNDPAAKADAVFDTSQTTEAFAQKGQVIFSANCKVCHSLDKNNPTGLAPVLVDIAQNWPDKETLAKYIKNAPAMMQSTEHSRKVYSEWKDKSQMPPFGGLGTAEIESIIAFIYMY